MNELILIATRVSPLQAALWGLPESVGTVQTSATAAPMQASRPVQQLPFTAISPLVGSPPLISDTISDVSPTLLFDRYMMRRAMTQPFLATR